MDAHAHVFLGTISAQKVCLKEIHTYVSPGLGAEEGANACLGEVVEKCKNVRTWAWAQRLRGDMQLELMQMGLHKKINTQQGHPSQRKGTYVQGEAWQHECAQWRGTGFFIVIC
jgi:hypothetical protein